MATASIRKASSLPAATGRNAGSVRFDASTKTPKVSTGTNWADLTHVDITYRQLSNAEVLDELFYIANRPMKVVAIREVHATAGTGAGAVTLAVKKATGTQAITAGTVLHSNTINLKGTANTVQVGTLSTSAATLTLAAGDRLGVDITGAIDDVAGVVVTVTLQAV